MSIGGFTRRNLALSFAAAGDRPARVGGSPEANLTPLLLSLANACASSADPQSDESDAADDTSASGASNTSGSRTSGGSEVASSNASSSSGGASNGSTSGSSGPGATTASNDAGSNTGTASGAGGSGGPDAIGGAGGGTGSDDSDDGTSAAGAGGDNDGSDPPDDEIEPCRVEAMAITRARLDALREEDESGSTGSSTGGGTPAELDPNDLFLRFSDLGVMCTEAFRPAFSF